LVFDHNSKIIKYNKIYPIFPWNDEIKQTLLNNSSFKEDYTSKFEFYEEIIKKQKIEIDFYEKRIKEYEIKEKNLKEQISTLEKNK
jgi:hypothetical protein